MTSILAPDTPLATYYEQVRPLVGTTSRRDLGTLDAVTISRYALTIGASDPVHFDREAARAAGHVDVVAPANMLAAVFEWGIGTPESDLNVDGTPVAGDDLVGATGLDLRAMGAGERMELNNSAVAGMHLTLETTVTSVTPKDTRGGPCVFVTATHIFLTADGTTLNRNARTIVLRNPHEES